jgi:hypothetical protein
MESKTLEIFADEAAARQRLEAAELGTVLKDSVLKEASFPLLAAGSLFEFAQALRHTAEPRLVVGVLAQAMQRQAAVWWACRVARAERDGGVAEREAAAIDAAETWLRGPEQWKAYAANDAAKSVGLDSPAGCAALSAFLAGESLGPSHVAPLPPGHHLTGMAVASAVELAATRRPTGKPESDWEEVLDLGFAIASGSEEWQTAATP